MSGIEGVLGAIGTAISVINYVQGKLQKSRRQGQAIEDLRPILQLLQEMLAGIDEEGNQDIIGDIERHVRDVTELIDRNANHRVRALTFLWTTSVEEDVQRITNALTIICHTLGFRERRRSSTAGARSTSAASHPKSPKLLSSSPQPLSSSPRFSTLDSLKPHTGSVFLPTTIVLKDAHDNFVRDPIQLNRFSILSRDNASGYRTIQFESEDHSLILTHQSTAPYLMAILTIPTTQEQTKLMLTVRIGTIPNTPNRLDACEVSFLSESVVTFESEDEYAAYCLDPTYEFDKVETCNDFMAQVRERELVASFLPKEITKRSESSGSGGSRHFWLPARDLSLARLKVVRIWAKWPVEDRPPLITLSFHDRTKNPPRYSEWSLGDFRPRAIIVSKGKVVELSRPQADEQFLFSFETSTEAQEFKRVVEQRDRSPQPKYRIRRRPLSTNGSIKA